MAEWYIVRDEQRYGPYTAAQLKQYAGTGHLLPIDLVIKDGMKSAVPASRVNGLFLVAPAPAATPPVPVAAQPDEEEDRPVRRRRAAAPNRLPLILGAAGLGCLVLVVAVAFVFMGGKKGSPSGTSVPFLSGDSRSFAEKAFAATGAKKSSDFKPMPAGSREDFLDAIDVMSERLARSPVRPGAKSKCFFPAPGCEAEQWHKVFGKPERLPDGRERIGRVENTFHRWRHQCKDGSITLAGKLWEGGGKTYYNPNTIIID